MIESETSLTQLHDYIHAFLDPSRELTLADIRSLDRARFEPIRTTEPNFSNTRDAVWLRLEMINATGQDARRLLVLETNFMYRIDVFLTDRDGEELLLHQTEDSTFDTRPVAHPNLVTKFAIPRDESATLWIRYASLGDTFLPMAIETEDSFVTHTQATIAKIFLSYAIVTVFLGVSLVAFVLQRQVIFLNFFLYAGTVFLYLLHRDGYAFQYLWPGAPGFNNFASLPLGCALAFFAALFTRSYLSTSTRYPNADKLLLAIMVIAVGMVAAALVIDQGVLKTYAFFLVSVSAVCLLGVGVMAWRKEGRRVRYFVAGWLGIVTASIIVTGISLFGLDVPRSTMLDAIRIAMVFDASMMGLAVMEGINILRRERDNSLKENMSVLQANLALHARLNDLEKHYQQAQIVAENRGQILADATHDIRQPLFSLRATLEEIFSQERPSREKIDHINSSFVYLESLVEEYMQSALGGTENQALKKPAATTETPVSMILNSLGEMFGEEAAAKGLRLRMVETSQVLPVDAMTLLRITSNLTSNAVKYTRTGSVLIGCRRRGGQTGIEVHDTGPGLSEAEIEDAFERSRRGAEAGQYPDGKGLGLDIVAKLARENGLILEARSVPGKGTSFRISPG